ncbi:winged helix-turn-helix transcriptional regulator [Fortiea sp. LEGE XX443]|uniref:MarR family winged helix-turn-helix transcriptional regulator n=1 Tax=Fortiea sp. LEGE XX443 TaxID=1828611 RepID=UPI001882C477|nr:MarR family winged helix-turn-helix transcriptional regulator [Fortiea sp. LEGE XX443]MBE9006926.1 winged helix-turn-helix transcriptional regulator [Fortiea sp. LEGE XX443]
MNKAAVPINLAQLNQVGVLCTCFNLRKASRIVTQFFDQELQPSGLLVTQFTILVAIAIVGSGTINELAQGLAMDRTTLTRNLKPLEREGFIQIEPGQDQRTRVVTLTTAGQNTLAKALPLWQQAQACIVEKLGHERWSTLLSHLSATTALVSQI